MIILRGATGPYYGCGKGCCQTYGTRIFLCHADVNGTISNCALRQLELMLDSCDDDITLVCCHPNRVREKEGWFRPRLKVMGDWDGQTWADLTQDDELWVYTL